MANRYSQRNKGNSKASQLRVLVDMDGVLCDFEQHFLDLFREKYPDNKYIPLDQRRSFYLSDDYNKVLNSENRGIPMAIYEEEGFFRDLPAIDGAIDAVKEMSSLDNVEVFICTSPVVTSKFCLQEKMEWIRNYFGQDWTKRMIITKDKTLVDGHLLIDDRPYIKGVLNPPDWEHILFTCCHNKHLDVAKLNAKQRLNSWTGDEWKQVIESCRKRLA